MDMLIGWGVLLVIVGFFAALLRFAGPPGEAKPHCSVGDGSGSGGCCH
jgi:hypothetical protein